MNCFHLSFKFLPYLYLLSGVVQWAARQQIIYSTISGHWSPSEEKKFKSNESVKNLPVIEIYVRDERVHGNTGCNTFDGKIKTQ